MKIAAALQSVQQLYIETAPFIYYVEAHPQYIKRMDAIIYSVENIPIKACSSVITLTEVLSHPMKLGDKKLEQSYRDILLNSPGYQLIPLIRELRTLLRTSERVMACVHLMRCMLLQRFILLAMPF